MFRILVVNKRYSAQIPITKLYYVGRPSGLGNPFQISREFSRKDAIKEFRRLLTKNLNNDLIGGVEDCLERLKHLQLLLNKARIAKVQGEEIYLECWCAPKEGVTTSDLYICHAQVIAEEIEKRL